MCSIHRSSPLWLLVSLISLLAFNPGGAPSLHATEPGGDTARPGAQRGLGPASSPVQPPSKARELLETLATREGRPLPGYVGGGEFRNRERRLPKGRYREYDVNPKPRGRPRDAERIVIEQRTGKAYYTPDHYRTFIPLN